MASQELVSLATTSHYIHDNAISIPIMIMMISTTCYLVEEEDHDHDDQHSDHDQCDQHHVFVTLWRRMIMIMMISTMCYLVVEEEESPLTEWLWWVEELPLGELQNMSGIT